METTPNDLRQQQFEIKFRGYNPDDVEVFRDLAATALEEARAEILKLTEENNHLSERLKHLVSMEDTLKAAVIETQKNAEITLDNARREAQVTIEQAKKEAALVIREAHTQREEITGDTHRKMGKLVGDINKIRYIKAQYLTELQSMVASQLKLVERVMAEDEKDEEEFEPPEPMAEKKEQSDWRVSEDMAPPAEEPEAYQPPPAVEENFEHNDSPALDSAPPPEQTDMLENISGNGYDTDKIPQVAPQEPQYQQEPQQAQPQPAPQYQPEQQQVPPPLPQDNPNPPPAGQAPKGENVSEEWQDLAKQLNEE